MNEVNKLLRGLFQGGTQVAGGIFDRADRLDAQSQFTEYKTGLMNTYQQLMAQNQRLLSGVETPEGDIQQGNSSVNQNPIVDPMQEYEKLMGLQSNLAGNKYGEPLVKQAEQMYNTLLGKDNQPNYEIREVNGQLVRYDKTNPNKFEVVYGNPKKEKVKNTAGDYSKMTLDQVNSLEPNEIENAFYYFSPEVQAELKKNPYFQQLDDKTFKEGDFAPKLNRGGKINTGGKINLKGGQSDDLTMFNGLDNINKTIRAGQELTPDQQKYYNTARLTLGNKYNLNDTELSQVIDQLNEATTDKERKQIMQSLDKGTYYNNAGTNQEQIDYDRNRILEWQQALNDAYAQDPNSYDGYKQNFLKELQDFYQRGSITKKEYDDLRKSYF